MMYFEVPFCDPPNLETTTVPTEPTQRPGGTHSGLM